MTNNRAPKHIGIIACSYEGAALCYKTICNEGSIYLGEHAHPEISLHTHPLHEYMVFINNDNWSGVADLMISSANKLTVIGSEILICPDNTCHQAYDEAKEKITTTWLHIAEEVSNEAKRNGFKKIGILGTKYTMENNVYPQKLTANNMEYETPPAEERNRINDIIFNELVYGVIKEESKKYFLDAINGLKSKGCDAVVLGCTEIPLIVMPEESSLPTLDSTRILARAALKAAIQFENLKI